jgi:homocysteine S-methyltransferase
LLEAPEKIKQVHHAYFEAGADCTITASYQATFEGLAQRGLSQQEATDIMQLSVKLAVAARDEFWAEPANRHTATGQQRPKPLIAASIGPYGAYLADGSEYRGDYGLAQAELMAFHRPRLAVLAQTKADLFACESIPCLLEAQALVQLLAEFPNTYAWVSFTAKDGSHISHGETITECATWLNAYPQIVAIGVNCTPPEHIESLVQATRAVTDKPIIVYPNSGEGYSADDQAWIGPAQNKRYGQQAQQWHDCGANIIGGCCRTTPANIAEVAAWVRKS